MFVVLYGRKQQQCSVLPLYEFRTLILEAATVVLVASVELLLTSE